MRTFASGYGNNLLVRRLDSVMGESVTLLSLYVGFFDKAGKRKRTRIWMFHRSYWFVDTDYLRGVA